MNKGPLQNRLEKWSKTQPISMHVPGHKNQTIGDLSFVSAKYDITEITGFDDLHQPDGLLKESMAAIDRHPDYDAYFLVNGTTSGILATIQAFQPLEQSVVIARNVHKSVFHALDLGGQSANILPTETDDITGQYVRPSQINSYKAKLGVVTYPNYYGQIYNIKQIIQQFHQSQTPVLVDEAHGAHFDLEGFPSSSLNFGADYVVQSFHKTLPSLTMSSILFIHKDAPRKEDVIRLLQTFQSSSPSYLLMASLESAYQFYKIYRSDVFFARRTHIIQILHQKKLCVIEMDDPLKLLIRCPGVSGVELQQCMENMGIYVELADSHSVLWILPLWHEGDSFPFHSLIERIQHMVLPTAEKQKTHSHAKLFSGGGKYLPTYISCASWIPFTQAVGKILAQHLVLYPPGVPSLLKGEKVTSSMVKLIDDWITQGFRIEGLVEGKIKVKDDSYGIIYYH
ncbi:lysine decarboxylase [Staphylococcus sp. 17KM0847]|uniref:lysine decarboxylase n=1 Tax=Staphylococcus sp. 17KM0847 TaxID=2583989 RepID=UPI0015DBE256|nr:lysine decarboxylase [Staphylococcus sp. 17KM0847]QLK85277.1 lysine decarboxylase [Staphylococcus sp. 17KM0847]